MDHFLKKPRPLTSQVEAGFKPVRATPFQQLAEAPANFVLARARLLRLDYGTEAVLPDPEPWTNCMGSAD
ncbi:hypothetical protein JQ596_37135 [Bradyrhizobium manausense]|uniref:hypothetical protein n=1 Tax=Bradyrhizobium arachidis TaxID=858423 RepID=UPI0021635D2B|nr:hypothetical protein [Bradyrhizobium arachidis]MBR0831147.1 hypothetical protein [Bradyrhizobium manausense]UVO29180.1 hypothetical protein KUF59_43380 [Bradyrhizobium arachidis]